jgi:hypothetical protein
MLIADVTRMLTTMGGDFGELIKRWTDVRRPLQSTTLELTCRDQRVTKIG